MSMLTTEEIINLYLWGDKVAPTPEAIADDKYIRGKDERTTEFIDAYDYMTNGAGRYGTADRFKMFERFFAGEGNFKAGEYDFLEFGEKVYGSGFDPKDITIGFTQYGVDMDSDDFVDRSYVFGSTEFTFDVTSVRFVVNEDGTREIVNLKIVPEPDNFDYKSDNFLATVTNILSEETIDPSGIGRPVDLIFINDAPVIDRLTKEDFEALQKKTSSVSVSGVIDKSKVALKYLAKYASMWWNQKFTYLDSEGRHVVFDGKDINNDGDLSAPFGNSHSAALIGGNG